MLQSLVSSVPSGAIIALVALAFALCYRTFKFIDMSLPILFLAAPYAAYFALEQGHVSLGAACLIGIVISCLLAAILEISVWKYLRKRASASILLLASLGIYTVFIAVLSLIFGHDIRSLLPPGPRSTIQLADIVVTDIQVGIIVLGLALPTVLWWILNRTRYGTQCRAMACSNDLARISGIPIERHEILVSVLSALLLGVAGILCTLDLDLDPLSGFRPFLWGVVAAILGGFRSVVAVAISAMSLVLGLSACGWFVGSKWEDSLLLVILVLVALFIPRPTLQNHTDG